MLTKVEKTVTIATHQNDRKEVAKQLTLLLADTYALYLKTQNFHWNVKGTHFPVLHLMFEKQYQELAAAVDEIAERLRALGSQAPGSFSEFLELTSLEEAQGEIPAGGMIEKLMHDHERLARSTQAMCSQAEEANDQASLDLFTERMRAHEKTAWMLRSTLED